MVIKKIGVALLMVLGGVMLLRFVVGGNEDDWRCTDQGWVKHGNPSGPMPEERCE